VTGVRALLVAALMLAGSGAQASAPSRPRIVSLAPHLAELVFAAGAGELLVGVVEYSDYPEAARRLPRVGDAWRVDMERLLALKPDLVLTWASGTPDDVVARLTSLGLAQREIVTYRLADVPAALRAIGELAATERTAEAAARDFERQMAELARANAGARPIRVFIQLDDQPLYTVNGRHIISEVVGLCGGRNVFAALPQLAPSVSLEAVIAADPEAIVSTDDTIADPMSMWRRWDGMRAVRTGAVYALPADTMARATPRLTAGTRATCAALDDARRRLAGSP
jgi:iron complex transport system substrate-binding protein